MPAPNPLPRSSVTKTGIFEHDELIRAFSNAYTFALDISAQVERASITEELHSSTTGRVERLFSEVIQKAINLAPYIEVSHSSGRHWSGKPRVVINELFDLDLPPAVVGDPGILTSIFKDLLENSIKYSKRDEGTVIYISWKEDSASVYVSVRDHGIGILPEDAERIFTRGVRSERAKRHSVRGNGLGLAYCSRVVRSFGGSIHAVPLEDGLEIVVHLRKAANSSLQKERIADV